MKGFLRGNGLGLGFGLLFLLSPAGQAISGEALLDERRLADGNDPVGLLQYLVSSDAGAVPSPTGSSTWVRT
ncbi:DUF6766 family protein [Actinosynnema sp. NPDC050436]|uniref:DUF6766 family protein n=1 Tax=Actinosynnema sp. NPDC050436 TaxID=3155659 RepID=UPI003410F5DA